MSKKYVRLFSLTCGVESWVRDKDLFYTPAAGLSGMSQIFSLAFRLDERAGDGALTCLQLIKNRIHLHDKRAGVSRFNMQNP